MHYTQPTYLSVISYTLKNTPNNDKYSNYLDQKKYDNVKVLTQMKSGDSKYFKLKKGKKITFVKSTKLLNQ